MARAGRKLRLPLLNREIPLVADEWAKPEMGSGCVKITPAHDPNDYEVGRRRGLPMINILNRDGTLNENAGPYKGLFIQKARHARRCRSGSARPGRENRRPRNRSRPYRPLENADRAVSGRSMVRADGRPRPIGDGCGHDRAKCGSFRSDMQKAIWIGSAKNAIGR